MGDAGAQSAESADVRTLREALADAANTAHHLLLMVDPDDLSDVRGPEGQHEGEYRAASIVADVDRWLTLAQFVHPPCDCGACDWEEGDEGAIRCARCGGYTGEPGTSIRLVSASRSDASVAASVLEQAPPERAPEEAPGAPDGDADAVWLSAMRKVGREGMVTVWNLEGRYLGCMGEEKWSGRLREQAAGALLRRERDDALARVQLMHEFLRSESARSEMAFRERDDARAALGAYLVLHDGLDSADYPCACKACVEARAVLSAPGTGAPVPAPLGVGGDEEAEQSAASGAPDGRTDS